jgi:hypothetical protein
VKCKAVAILAIAALALTAGAAVAKPPKGAVHGTFSKFILAW